MHEVLTISHTCPICGETGLQILLERNVRAKEEFQCSNDDYAHLIRDDVHYFVRKSANVVREINDSRFDSFTWIVNKPFNTVPQP